MGRTKPEILHSQLIEGLDPISPITEAEQMCRLAHVQAQISDKDALAEILHRLPGVDPLDPAFDCFLRE
jgi:hypothetical protein